MWNRCIYILIFFIIGCKQQPNQSTTLKTETVHQKLYSKNFTGIDTLTKKQAVDKYGQPRQFIETKNDSTYVQSYHWFSDSLGFVTVYYQIDSNLPIKVTFNNNYMKDFPQNMIPKNHKQNPKK